VRRPPNKLYFFNLAAIRAVGCVGTLRLIRNIETNILDHRIVPPAITPHVYPQARRIAFCNVVMDSSAYDPEANSAQFWGVKMSRDPTQMGFSFFIALAGTNLF